MGLYYLQSRYYDPELCRFLNADAFVSTGQGELGNNMFAYCLNNPVLHSDPYGTNPIRKLFCYDMLSADGGGGTAVILGFAFCALWTTFVPQLVEQGSIIVSQAYKEVYDFSQMLRQKLIEVKESMPNVHHIVPVGNFSTRNPTTYMQIQEMHTILKNAGINYVVDPMNLVLVSSKTHASLHTDLYIAHVYSYISSTDGTKEQIYWALFLLRLEIAAQDGYANGY